MLNQKIINLFTKQFLKKGKKLKLIKIFYKAMNDVAKKNHISLNKLLYTIYFYNFSFLSFKNRKIKVKRGKQKINVLIPEFHTYYYSPIKYTTKILSQKIKIYQRTKKLSLYNATILVLNEIYTKPNLSKFSYKPLVHLETIKKSRAYMNYIHWLH